MAEEGLHRNQLKLLKILADNIEAPLTMVELQEQLGVKSTSVVAHHIHQLEKKGYLRRNPYNSRDYQIIRGGPESPVAHINLYGLATCGHDGKILDGNPIETIPISTKLLGFDSVQAFMVKARGKSMEPKIRDGDLIIAKRIRSKPEDGRIYVCVNKGEALIKRVRKFEENYILESINTDYSPIIAYAKDNEFWVEGEVKRVISGF